MPQCAGTDMSGRCVYKAEDGSEYCKQHRQSAPRTSPQPRHSPEIGEKKQSDGITRVTISNSDWIAMVTPILWHIARTNGKVCSDDLRYHLRDNNLPWPESENAFGAAVKNSGLQRTDESTKSTWPDRNAGRSFYWIVPRSES